MLAPKPLMRAEPLAFLPVSHEDPTPLAANLLVSHDPVNLKQTAATQFTRRAREMYMTR